MANATIIYAATTNGLAIFNKPGTPGEWLPPRIVLEGQVVNAVWAEPGPPIRVLVSVEGGLLLSRSGGRTWENVDASDEPELAEFMALAELQTPSVRMPETTAQNVESDSLYVLSSDGMRVSTDGGATWATLPGSPQGGTVSLTIPGAAGKPPALVVGTESGLTVSQDGGATWQEVRLPHEGGVTALVHDPERRDRLYAAIGTGYLFESNNRGQAWQTLNHEPVAEVVGLFVLKI